MSPPLNTHEEDARAVNGHGVVESTSGKHTSLVRAMHRLADAISAPAPGREEAWARTAADATRRLLSAMADHRAATESTGGLYEAVSEVQPHLAQRVQYLKDSNHFIAARGELLLEEVERIAGGLGGAFMAVRTHALDLLGEVRQQQAREVDLMFEVYHRDDGGID